MTSRFQKYDRRLRVTVSRRLPQAVETRMAELFDVELNFADTALSRAELTARMAATDVFVPTVTDEIDAALVAIKGAGAAMLREKVVAQAAARMAVIADGSKHVARVGAAKLPVEVLPFARAFVSAQLTALGARVGQRAGVVTDNGNIILDAAFGAIADPPALAAAIAAIPGALGHGLFVGEVDAAYIAADGVVTRLERDEMNR